MKSIIQKRITPLIFILLITGLTTVSAQNKAHSIFKQADDFLREYVKDGSVDYTSIKNNPEKLNSLIDEISSLDLRKFSTYEERKALLINAYNILTIKLVIQNYPLISVQNVGGFFNQIKVMAFGESLTLDELEKDIIFGEYKDPRLHFVLVCAAVGCPQIINNAYTPDKLEKFLDERTRITLNDDYYVRVDTENEIVFVSEIFSWYKNDFTQYGQSIISYINKYRSDRIPENYSISYITYDWRLNDFNPNTVIGNTSGGDNLQAYTPSTLLKSGQYEIKFFNNLYTQTSFFDGDGKRQDQNSRSTFFTAITNFLYGINPSVNVGFDLYFRSVRNDAESSSPFSLFNFSSNNNSRSAIAQVGPKIKVSPFESAKNLAFQGTILFPLESDLDGSENPQSPFLDVDGIQLWTQAFYDLNFSQDFLGYFESGVIFRFNSQFEDFYIPLKGIINYYPSAKWTIYIPGEFTSFWDGSVLSAFYSQLGIGGKYQITSRLELEALLTKFLFGKSQGAGMTYNFGFRFIH